MANNDKSDVEDQTPPSEKEQFFADLLKQGLSLKFIEWVWNDTESDFLRNGSSPFGIDQYIIRELTPYFKRLANDIRRRKSKELQKLTCHLQNFEQLTGAIALRGEGFTTLNKFVYYQLVGIIAKHLEVRLGRVREDTRLYFVVILPPGRGKSNYKAGIVAIVIELDREPGMKMRCKEIYSLHPEQLIGTTIEVTVTIPDENGRPRRVKKRIPNPGHFFDDYLLFEEAASIFEKPKPQALRDASDVRGALCIAYDSPGKNRIQKRLTGVTNDEMLDYLARCCAAHFVQVVIIDPMVTAKGFARRNAWFSPATTISCDEIIDYQLADGDTDPQEKAKQFAEYLRLLKSAVVDGVSQFTFTPEIRAAIKQYAKLLAKYIKAESRIETGFDRTVGSYFLKFVAIASIFSRNAPNVTLMDVKIAFMDCYEFLVESIKTQNDHLGKNDDDDHSALFVLDWLREQTTPPTIATTQRAIMEQLNVGDRQARRYLSQLRHQGLVTAKQEGRSSVVKLVDGGQSGQGGHADTAQHETDLQIVRQAYLAICEEVLAKFDVHPDHPDRPEGHHI